MKKNALFFLFLLFNSFIHAQETPYQTISDIRYYNESETQTDEYIQERCVLDIYYPENIKNFPTIVWLHGGGLTFGNKYIPKELKEKGVAIVAVNYRLYPKIKAPIYIEDAAAAVAWTFKNIEKYGGDADLVFVSGHSAGGYLASMVGMDKRWLKKHEIDANDIAGLIPFSGHTITHFTVRKERGIGGTQPIIDYLAPIYHVRKDAPPLLLITGDRELELLGRYEENAYMMRMMKEVGHRDTRIMELDGYGHSMTEPAFPLLLNEVRRIKNIKTRPNIVFVIADDMSWKHLGAYGSDELHTPNIDRLANEGVVFENAFVSTPSCTPSRASILTGRNGFELEEGASLWGYLSAKFPTYTELLEAKGFRTASTGKGWGPGLLIDRKVNPAGQPYSDIRRDMYSEFFEKSPVSDIDYAANFETFLKTTDENQPFCFWVGTFEPHRGYKQGLAEAEGLNCEQVTVPDFMPNVKEVRDDICEYYAEIQYVDRTVGGVMEVLKRQDQLENTLIVVTSDNGMPFPRAKATLYDYGTRMPLIVWWGDKIKGGRRISDFVSFPDIAPTFLETAGIDKPLEMSGKSFLPQLKSDNSGQIDSERNTAYLYRERHAFSFSNGISTPSRAIRTNKYLLIQNFNTDSLTRDIDGGLAKDFMVNNQSEYADLYEMSFGKKPEFELYDIQKDEFQMNNLIGDAAYSEVSENLKNDLHTYLKKRRDPRILGEENPFLYNPYFGYVFTEGLLKWTPVQQGQKLTFEERRELLKKAFSRVSEEAWCEEMIKRQNGKL